MTGTMLALQPSKAISCHSPALTPLHRSSLAGKIMPLRSILQPRARRYVSGEATWKSPLGPNQSPISARNWKNACGLRRCWRTFQHALSMCPPTTSTPKLLTHSAAFASAPGLTSPRSGSSRPGNTLTFSCRLTTIDLWRGLRLPTACCRKTSTWGSRVQRLQADAGPQKVSDDVRKG